MQCYFLNLALQVNFRLISLFSKQSFLPKHHKLKIDYKIVYIQKYPRCCMCLLDNTHIKYIYWTKIGSTTILSIIGALLLFVLILHYITWQDRELYAVVILVFMGKSNNNIFSVQSGVILRNIWSNIFRKLRYRNIKLSYFPG